MKKVKYYIKDLYEILCQKLTEKSIGDMVCVDHRPIGIGEQCKSLTCINLPSEIIDNGAYQSSFVLFSLYTRDRSGGIASTDKLQEMLDKLLELFPIIEGRFTLTSPRIILKGSDENGFTLWVVQVLLVINTTDRLFHGSK